jgi:hypothetical protein
LELQILPVQTGSFQMTNFDASVSFGIAQNNHVCFFRRGGLMGSFCRTMCAGQLFSDSEAQWKMKIVCEEYLQISSWSHVRDLPGSLATGGAFLEPVPWSVGLFRSMFF